eukprot:scaffold142191_cov130-Phaeocystis_antarctica.AAC.2
MPVTCKAVADERTVIQDMVNGQIHDYNAHAHADICVQKKKGHPASLARKQASHASRGEETSSSELVATRLACRYTFSCHTRGVRPLLRVMFEAGLHLFGQVDLPLPEAHLRVVSELPLAEAHEFGKRDGAAAVRVHLREAHRLLSGLRVHLSHVCAEAAAAHLPGAAIGVGRPRALHEPQRQPELARVELAAEVDVCALEDVQQALLARTQPRVRLQ